MKLVPVGKRFGHAEQEVHPKPLAGGWSGLKLHQAKNFPMQQKTTQTRIAQPRVRRLLYRIVNHPEAGVFDSMTGANIWALQNFHDWDWAVEPMPGKLPI